MNPDPIEITGATTTWYHSKSKVATNLNDNLRSTVTLTLPSAEDELTSDIVFVLDTSDCVGDVMEQVQGLVTELKAAHEANPDANIRVGVVVFKGSAGAMFGGRLVSVDEAVSALTRWLRRLRLRATLLPRRLLLSDTLLRSMARSSSPKVPTFMRV